MSEAALRGSLPVCDFAKGNPCEPIWHELNEIHKQLKAFSPSKPHSSEDLKVYHAKLGAIDNARESNGGVFGFDPTQPVPEGQALCSEALAACFAELDVLESTASEMGAPMTELVKQLEGIKKALTKHAADKDAGDTCAAEIKKLQGQLNAIDSKRLAHHGVFCGDVATDNVPAGQAHASSLLAECYALVESIHNKA